MKKINEILNSIYPIDNMRDIQKVQTEHRLKLAEFWGVRKGDRILEIGCGQGDTTAVLAHLVGENGFVNGIDIASPDYGAPLTLGESSEYLKRSKLGERIKMQFEIDLLTSEVNFSDEPFDLIVFSHSSWYLKSFEELGLLLKKTSEWGKQLAFAEWDPRITNLEQFPHFLAVLIQAQYESCKEISDSNVRTLFTPSDVRSLTESAGWTISREKIIRSPKMQDGEWEIRKVLTDHQSELNKIGFMPEKYKSLIQSEIKILGELAKEKVCSPMSTYAFTAD